MRSEASELTRADLAGLVESARELAAEVSLRALLQSILAKAGVLTRSPDTGVILFDEPSKSLYFAAATGRNAAMLLETWGEFSERRVPLFGSKAGEVFRTGRPLVIQAVTRESRHFKGIDRDTRRATRSMVCVPLQVAGHRLGVMQILNKRSGPYTARDRVLLENLAAQAAVAIRNAQLFESLLAHMGLYASRERGEGPLRLLEELEKPARAEKMSVVIADMRGFTQLCQMLNDAGAIHQILNEFLAVLSDEVIGHGGVVNKFLGDGLLALFRRKDHERDAVRCAFSMVERFAEMLRRWNDQSNLQLDFLDIGIRIVTDTVVIGTIRSGRVRDFTVVGNAVNLASYFEQHARDGKRILADRMTYLAVRDFVGEIEGPEKIELKKPDQAVGHPYVQYHLKSLRAPGRGAGPAVTAPAAADGRSSVFISYSHRDKDWLARLQTHLKPYERTKKVFYWDDTKIKPGARWREEIKKALTAARVAVLLVSPDFLASDFIADNELPPLLNAAQNNGLKILWIPLKPSAYEQTEIREYQAAAELSKPLNGLKEADQDEALVKIARSIVEAASPARPAK